MKKLLFTTLALVIVQFFLAPAVTEAKVLYEQSKVGTSYDLLKPYVNVYYGLSTRYPQYIGTGPIYPGEGEAYEGTADWLRVKRISGVACDVPSNVRIFSSDGNTEIGEIGGVGRGTSTGPYCDFPITGPNRTNMIPWMIAICVDGSCTDRNGDLVLDGSPENKGFVDDGTRSVMQPGGWAFQICDSDGCSGGFEVSTTTATSTPTTTPPTATSTGASSVLFLPGIQASRLYTEGLLGTENQLWETNGNVDVQKLLMTDSGQSVNSIYTRDIPGSVYLGYASIYGGFIQYMNKLVEDNVIKNWRPYAYDWRFSVDDIANNGTQYQTEIKNVINEIENLAASSSSGKVTIIGHSNGGLLAKAVMIRLEALSRTNLIENVVFLASPQLGTPKAIGSILHGYDQELGKGYIVDDAVARDVMKDMPGAYGLIPSAQYFIVSTSSIIKFENSTSTKIFRDVYGSSIDSMTELSGFMTGSVDGRVNAVTLDEAMRANSTLVQKGLTLHNTIDNWVAPAGVKVIEIIGTGLDTISGFEYRSYTERVCSFLGFLSCTNKTMYKPVPLITQFGDQTVVGQSAEGYRGEKDQYFIDLKKIVDLRKEEAVQHYNISENPSIQKLIKNIITTTTSDIDFITAVPNSTATNRLMFGTHSPVTLEVKDKQGRRVGRGTLNNISVPIEEIPGSTYLEIGSSTYVIVPDGVKYDLAVKGTDQGGLTFSLDTLKGGTQLPVIAVNVATITPSTSISLSYDVTTMSNLSIDQNGDGVTDQILTPQGVDVTPKVTYATLKNSIQKLSLSVARKTTLLLIVGTAETLDKNPKLSALETLTLNQLEALLVVYQKNNWITQTDLLQVKSIISKLK